MKGELYSLGTYLVLPSAGSIYIEGTGETLRTGWTTDHMQRVIKNTLIKRMAHDVNRGTTPKSIRNQEPGTRHHKTGGSTGHDQGKQQEINGSGERA